MYNVVLVSDVQQSVSVIYIYILFSYSFPLLVITRYLIEFPLLHNRSLLFIYFIYSSMYMLIAKS